MPAVAPANVPLLLLCAEDSEVALVHLVDALNRNGRSPEVIAGVEHETSLLSDATDRTRGAALFVLCQSEELDRSQALRLEGLFSARKGPEHHLLIVDLGDPSALKCLPLIEAAMESVARGHHLSPQESAARAANVPTRDVVVLPGRGGADRSGGPGSRQGARDGASTAEARRDPEALARALHEEMLAAEAVLERRRSSRTEFPEDDDAPVSDGVPHPVDEDADAPTKRIQTEADDDPASESDPEPSRPSFQPSAQPSVSSRPASVAGSLTSSLSKVRVAEPLSAIAEPATIQTELTPTEHRKRLREPPRDDETPVTQSPPGSRAGLFLGILGAAALGGLGLFVLNGAGNHDTDVPAVAAAHAAGTNAARSDAATSAPTRAASRSAGAPAVPTTKAAGLTNTLPAQSAVAPAQRQASDTVAQPENDRRVEAQPPSVVDAEPSEGTAEPPVAPSATSAVPPPPVDSEPLRIDQAIRNGQVRAIDSLLVAKAGTAELDWRQARSKCRTKRVDGLSGWRLPSRRELKRLRRARILQSGVFWSRDRGDVDDEAYALNVGTGTSHRYLVVEPVARVQCVRRR